MLVHMYLQLYVLGLKQPFKDHLPVVLECFHHLLSALLLWIFWRDSFFTCSVLEHLIAALRCALIIVVILFRIFFHFFFQCFFFFFLFCVVAVCCLYKASNLVVYHIRTLLFPASSHFAPLFSGASSSICWLLL